jgi:acyl phosphate:glycerol-3-phosphate acyltransferase
MRPLLVLLSAYLLGSIPFGYILVRLVAGADIRESGSGGTGATNVSRRAGKFAGVLTLLLDALKGAAAVLIARWVFGDQPSAAWWVAAAGIAALLGHIFPVWLGFRGGKGVATGVGIFLVVAPMAVAFAVWLTRYVSLGSLIAAGSLPLFILLRKVLQPNLQDGPLLFLAVVGAGLIIFAHRANITRLIAGTESKFR